MKEEDRIQVKSLLKQLQSMNYIKGDELEKLEKYYGVMNRPFEEVKLEILNFIEDRSALDKLLNSIEAAPEVKEEITQDEKAEDTRLTLENIEEIKKGDTEYIKIHYPYPEDKIELVKKGPSLMGTNAIEIFSAFQDQYSINSQDGSLNATIIFKKYLKENCEKVYSDDIEEFVKYGEKEKLTEEQLDMINVIRSKEAFKDKKITAAPEEGVFIISTPNSCTDDLAVTVTKKVIDGEVVYVVEKLENRKYKTNSIETVNDDMTKSTSDVNESYSNELDANDMNDLQKGNAMILKKKDKKHSDAAFVNILYFIVVLGIAASFVLYKFLMIRLNG